jgi:hypothetical protein
VLFSANTFMNSTTKSKQLFTDSHNQKGNVQSNRLDSAEKNKFTRNTVGSSAAPRMLEKHLRKSENMGRKSHGAYDYSKEKKKVDQNQSINILGSLGHEKYGQPSSMSDLFAGTHRNVDFIGKPDKDTSR